MSGGVKKIASVVVGAVIGLVQGGPVGAVIGAGLAFYAAEQQEKLNTKSPLRDNEPSAQTVRSSKAPVRFILGRVATGGVLGWAQEQKGVQMEGEWLHLVYVLCEGSVDALEEIFLGEEPISSFGAYASYELVVNPTQVNAFLKANCPDWKDVQIGRGLSFVRLSLMYSAEKFPSGIPDVRFVVRGRNDIFDPRTNTNVYSANTALHILWYLRNRCNVPDDEIVFSTFASAANVCDEALTNADGSVSQRYRSACVIGADELKSGVLQKLEAACAGRLIRVGGRWMLQAGAYYGPYDFEITEDMVIGTVGGSTEPTNDSAINTVRGTFIDPSQSWTETDYPEVSVAEWIAEDGGEAAETLTYSYVTDAYQPQRLANIELRRRRAGGVITIPMNFSGYNCRPGRVVRVNLPSLNILGEFIVTNWSMGDNEGCNVQVQQYEAAIFDDAVGQPYDPLGFINLPSGGLGSPTDLTWNQETGAEVVQGVLSWVAPAGIVTEYAVIVRQGSGVAQSHTIQAASNSCQINGLPSGSYTMSVAAIGPMARSGEVTITVSIEGPPIPESCSVQSSIDSITLTPNNVLHGLNGGTYEYFFSVTPQATAGESTYLGQGLSFTHTGLAFYTNYYYFIRSANAYGKSAFLYVPTATSNNVGTYLDAIKGKVDESSLAPALNGRIDLIDGDGPGSVNARNEQLRKDLEEQIKPYVDALLWDAAKAYVKGDIVRQGNKLYQALEANSGSQPPSENWKDVGDILTETNALAIRVDNLDQEITAVDGRVVATQEQLTQLQTKVNDPVTGLAATVNNVTQVNQRVTNVDNKLTAQTERIDGVYAEINAPMAGSENDLAGGTQGYAGVWSIQSAITDGDYAQGKLTQTVEAQVIKNYATYEETTTALVNQQTATTSQVTALRSDFDGNKSTVQTQIKTVSDQASATASQTTQLQTNVNGHTQQFQQQASINQDVNGKITGTYSFRFKFDVNGAPYSTGVGLGIETGANGQVTSRFVIQADQFAIYNGEVGAAGSSVPFAVNGTETYIKSAFIQDGTITNAKIGSYIQSNNYVAGRTGWKLFFDGTFEINGVAPGQGRSMMTNRSLRFWDANNVKRLQLGDQTE